MKIITIWEHIEWGRTNNWKTYHIFDEMLEDIKKASVKDIEQIIKNEKKGGNLLKWTSLFDKWKGWMKK